MTIVKLNLNIIDQSKPWLTIVKLKWNIIDQSKPWFTTMSSICQHKQRCHTLIKLVWLCCLRRHQWLNIFFRKYVCFIIYINLCQHNQRCHALFLTLMWLRYLLRHQKLNKKKWLILFFIYIILEQIILNFKRLELYEKFKIFIFKFNKFLFYFWTQKNLKKNLKIMKNKSLYLNLKNLIKNFIFEHKKI